MPESPITVRLRCPAVRANLGRVRAVVRSLLAGAPAGAFPSDDRDEILLAVQECLSNVLRHAYPDGGRRPIELTLTVGADGFRARVRDWGAPFDPAALPGDDDPGPPRERGYGLLLVGSTMDEVRRWRSGRSNWTELYRAPRERRPPGRRAPPAAGATDDHPA